VGLAVSSETGWTLPYPFRRGTESNMNYGGGITAVVWLEYALSWLLELTAVAT
jgi:hypothetical protein